MADEEESKNINPKPEEEKKSVVTGGGVTLPHIGKRKIIPLDLFSTGPHRGGSLGNWKKKK